MVVGKIEGLLEEEVWQVSGTLSGSMRRRRAMFRPLSVILAKTRWTLAIVAEVTS